MDQTTFGGVQCFAPGVLQHVGTPAGTCTACEPVLQPPPSQSQQSSGHVGRSAAGTVV